MSIVLLIFKILGMILLVLLALVLILVFLVLFCPVTYRIKGSYHEKVLKLHVRVFWPGCLLGMFADADDGNFHMYLRILGLRKSFSKHDNLEDFEDTIANDRMKTEMAAKEKVKDLTEIQEVSAERVADHGLHEESEDRNFAKIKQVISNLVHALKNFNDTRERIAQFMQDSQSRAAFRKIWDKIVYFFKKIKPHKLNLILKYSTGSPDTTGELLGILAMLPMGYQNRWNIAPDFVSEELYAEADFDVRGHLLGIWLLQALLGILLDKNCQKLYNKIRSKH